MLLGSNLAHIKTSRCGVIPFTISPSGKLLYLLARHRATKDLGDPGGGRRKEEFALGAGYREFHEETRGIFMGVYGSVNDLTDKVAVIDRDNMAIVFVPLSYEWVNITSRLFEEAGLGTDTGKRICDEISELVWVDEDEFRNMIYGNNTDMWKRVRCFFRRTKTGATITEALRVFAT